MRDEYTIHKLGDGYRFCGGGKPKKNMPVFEVTGPGFPGHLSVCAAHLATLVEAAATEENRPALGQVA